MYVYTSLFVEMFIYLYMSASTSTFLDLSVCAQIYIPMCMPMQIHVNMYNHVVSDAMTGHDTREQQTTFRMLQQKYLPSPWAQVHQRPRG